MSTSHIIHSTHFDAEQSSGVVRRTRAEVGTLGAHVASGHVLLGQVKAWHHNIPVAIHPAQKQQLRDAVLLYGGFALFLLTVVWILYKRTLGRLIH